MKRSTGDIFYWLICRANIVFTLSAVLLFSYLILDVSRPYQPLAPKSALKMQGSELEDREAAILGGSAVFKEDVFHKQLFSSFGGKGFISGNAAPVLLGISMGEKKLAMIRDTRVNKDYYCMEGDKIGEYTVKQILKSQVVLEGSSGNLLEISQ